MLPDGRKYEADYENTGQARSRKQKTVEHCRLLAEYLLKYVREKCEMPADAEQCHTEHHCKAELARLSQLNCISKQYLNYDQ